MITKWEEKSGEESECVPETAKITEMQSATEKGKGQQAVSRTQEKCCDDRLIQELLQKRQAIQERTDTEFVRCVMILPCDVVRLQQEGYQAGRSSFLQHAFYQYRHLLLALTREGDYVLGVPGIQNPQEQYMAEMFGYRDFRMPRVCGCGRVFGYWCRKLCRQ